LDKARMSWQGRSRSGSDAHSASGTTPDSDDDDDDDGLSDSDTDEGEDSDGGTGEGSTKRRDRDRDRDGRDCEANFNARNVMPGMQGRDSLSITTELLESLGKSATTESRGSQGPGNAGAGSGSGAGAGSVDGVNITSDGNPGDPAGPVSAYDHDTFGFAIDMVHQDSAALAEVDGSLEIMGGSLVSTNPMHASNRRTTVTMNRLSGAGAGAGAGAGSVSAMPRTSTTLGIGMAPRRVSFSATLPSSASPADE